MEHIQIGFRTVEADSAVVQSCTALGGCMAQKFQKILNILISIYFWNFFSECVDRALLNLASQLAVKVTHETAVRRVGAIFGDIYFLKGQRVYMSNMSIGLKNENSFILGNCV